MFGSTVAYIFEYLLGIKQADDSVGYKSLVISPKSVERFTRMSGSMKTASGIVAVKYENKSGNVRFRISIPVGTKAIFVCSDKSFDLSEGENEFEITL